ncbi:MAG: DNRLRE domain-containing protein [Deltaproteobacteria bacterium]|nr:DNRLRE domain-containing protein [Deltaproteobacteria bacterium]
MRGRLACLSILVLAGGCGLVSYDSLAGSIDGGLGQIDSAGEPNDAARTDAPPTEPLELTFGEDGVDGRVSGVTTDTALNGGLPDQPGGDGASFTAEAVGPIHGLLRFDLSSVPTTATVIGAELEVWTNFSPSQGGTAQLFRISEEWEEATATWNQRSTGVAWTDAGGTTAGEAVASITTVNESFFESLEQRLELPIGLVADWVAEPASNNGLLFVPTSGYVGLLSSEAVLIENAPILHIRLAAE